MVHVPNETRMNRCPLPYLGGTVAIPTKISIVLLTNNPYFSSVDNAETLDQYTQELRVTV